METDFRLCKIAVEYETNRVSQANDNHLHSFEYNGRRWLPLQPQFGETELAQLMALLEGPTNTSGRPSNVFYLTEVNDTEKQKLPLSLVLFHRPSKRIFTESIVMIAKQIYAIIFKNYNISEYTAALQQSAANAVTADEQSRNLMQELLTSTLYDALYRRHAECQPDIVGTLPTLPLCFQPTLCRFQARTVQWLLRREQVVTIIPAYYRRMEAKDDATSVYKHLLSQELRCSEPLPMELASGGILADEMGLGKTVEILVLIILNPCTTLPTTTSKSIATKRIRVEGTFYCLCAAQTKAGKSLKCNHCQRNQHAGCVAKFNDDEDTDNMYLCPECWYARTENAPLPVRTTFIVTPNVIKAQWLSEMRRHINPPLRVFDYNEAANGWISPSQLAKYDVVIADYNVLRREVYYTADFVSERVMRNRRPLMRRMTPLLMVKWWRVCLDEAQMVEGGSTLVAHITRQLPAVHRWAVTGTPIQRSIDDLRPLLQFIGFTEAYEPLCGWRSLIDDFIMHHNTTMTSSSTANKMTLIDVLQHCMWRTCKSKVCDELKLPPQTEQLHYIRLSNLEKLFYMEQHAMCESSFNHVVNKYLNNTDKILKISPQILKIVLMPLLKIRKCCIVPVVSPGNQHKNSGAVQQKQFLQPKDLHSHLKSTNELECKAELRAMALSYNGMAAIDFIRKQYDEAIKHYESVLRLARDYKDMNISVDSLLQIHALHNILQAYYISPKFVKNLPKETIEKYEQDYNALEWKYMETYASSLAGTRDAYLSTQQTLCNSEAEQLLEFLQTLNEEICGCNEQFMAALMHKLHDDLCVIFGGHPKLQEIQSIHGLLYIFDLWYAKVTTAQKSLEDEFEKLKFFTGNVCTRSQVSPAVWREMVQFIHTVNECHLSEIFQDEGKKKKKENKRKTPKKKPNLCKLCKLRDALNSFECLLFNKIVDKDSNMTDGTESPSFEVSLIKVMFTFLRSKPPFLKYAQQIDKHWEALECRQTLCKKLIKYWIEIEYTVKAYDELDMCKMRVSLTTNEDEKTHFNLLEYEVDESLEEQKMNLQMAQRRFAMKLARLKYIKHLEQDAVIEPCPICHSEDEGKYAVLECGHNICLFCLRTIRQYAMHTKLTCPICRNQQSSEKIYYLTRTAATTSTEDTQIVGDYSTKIAYIVRLILRLKREHANDVHPLKILIFSQWSEILSPIALALTANGIRHHLTWSRRTIEEFKNPQLGITCLLMNLRKGSNGLNLIEATHVFLVEPILNPGEEAQAIGRVHRFGQTRATVVHRFIVSNTIEENIHDVVSAGKETTGTWEFKQMTVESLRNLFHLENDVSEEYLPPPTNADD